MFTNSILTAATFATTMNRVVIALAALLLHAADVCAYVPSTAAASRRVHTALAASSSPTTSRRNALTSSGAALGLLLVSPSAARAEKTPSGTRYELAAEPGQEVTTCASRDPKPRRLQTITRVVVRPPPRHWRYSSTTRTHTWCT